MSKVPPFSPPYAAAIYLSLNEFLQHYGYTAAQITAMTADFKQKYQDWVDNANRTVEVALYKYNDIIPLSSSSETFIYAKSMARHWAEYEKAAEEGSPNAQAKKALWEMDKQHMIETLQSQPQKTTTRTVSGSSFPDTSPLPYSQSWGAADIL